MSRRIVHTVVAACALAVAAVAVVQAQEGKEKKAPPGMSEADMKACMEAATPGPKHAFLTDGTGVWTGPTTMWMAPGAEPVKSECTSTVTSIMDGRFVRC